MSPDDRYVALPDRASGTTAWPVVPAGDIGVADFTYDLAYMGVYARLEIVNRSPYLVRQAELRVDGYGQNRPGVVTSRTIVAGPLFPGEPVHEEIGIGDRAGISGLRFESVAAHAVRLTPPGELTPAAGYPGLAATVGAVETDEHASGVVLTVRVRNSGASVVERVRLRLLYFGEPAESARRGGEGAGLEAGWIVDMPHAGWDPHRLPPPPAASCEPAGPLPPGGVHEFAIRHAHGGPRGWARSAAATAVEVIALRLRP